MGFALQLLGFLFLFIIIVFSMFKVIDLISEHLITYKSFLTFEYRDKKKDSRIEDLKKENEILKRKLKKVQDGK